MSCGGDTHELKFFKARKYIVLTNSHLTNTDIKKAFRDNGIFHIF